MKSKKQKMRMIKGAMDHRLMAVRKSCALILAWSVELDKLRERYGYTLALESHLRFAPLWSSSAKVPAVKRKRMVKLMRMIDLAVMGYSLDWNYWADAPTLERYSWRCMRTGGDSRHLRKTSCGSPSQIREKVEKWVCRASQE